MEESSKKTVSLRRVKNANSAIRKAFRTAREVKQWVDEQQPGYDRGVAERARKAFQLGNVDDVRKLCLLADDERGFSKADLKKLYDLAEVERCVLRLTKLKRLLAIRDHDHRVSLAEKMVTERWSQAQTEAEIRIANGGAGHQAAGGRRPRSPQSTQQLLDELEKIATRWSRYVDVAKELDNWEKLSESDRLRIEAVSEVLIAQGFSIANDSQSSDG